MKKKLLASIFVLTLLVALIVCVGIGASAASTATVPTALDGQQIEVWLVAGQSNAFGDAIAENYPTDEAYAEYKTLLTNGASDVYHLYNSSTEFVPAAFGQGSKTHSGPEIGITTALSGKGKQNAIIKLAYGDTSLYNGTTSSAAIKYGTWTPPSYIQKYSINTNGNKTGDLYLSFILKVKEGLDKLVDAGYTPIIKGLWWMQGEADTFGEASSAAYAELLETLIADMRADLSKISGTNCSEMPFVYGRILANSKHAIPTYLADVQAAQDEVAAKNLKNVYMIDTTKDLIDPVTKTHRDPVQQDRWHYDSLSQQMIGEAFVRSVQGLTEAQTKYGYVPTDYADASDYPFALFNKVGENYNYAFDSAYSAANYDALMTRAITLTKADGTATTEEAVILLRADADTTKLPTYTSNIGKTVTIDLGGHTLVARNSLCNTATVDCLAEGATEAKNGTINVKNGTLLMGNHGILYAAKAGSGNYTLEKKLTLNFEDLNIGFADGASTTCKTLLGIAYNSHTGDVVAKYEMNFVNCNIDAVTNCPTDSSFKIAKLAASTETEANGYNSAVAITFKGCQIKVKDVNHLNIPMSPEGDSVTFIKGENGTYGKVILPTGTYANTYSGSDDGYATSVTYKATSTVSDGYTTYNLVGAGNVATPYGTIDKEYADANAYPFVIFMGGECIGAYATWKSTLTAAITPIAGTDTGNKTVQILLRKDYTQGTSDTTTVLYKTAGNIVFDLGGKTFLGKTYIWDLTFQTIDKTTDGPIATDSSIVVKNGELLIGYNKPIMASAYADNERLTAQTYNVTFENVDFGYASGATTTTPLYIINHNNRTVKSGTVNITFDNCNFDFTANAPSGKTCTWFNFKDTYDSVNITQL